MTAERNRVVIVADDYQFLDTLHGSSAAIVQEWQVANTLERLAELVIPAPLAVVIDLEAPGIDPIDALNLLNATRASSKLVLLAGSDLRKLANAKRVAESLSLEVAGTLERPLMMSALSRLLSRHAESRAPLTAEELQRGLREHELLLHYQPIFARQAKQWVIRSAEALVRWQHPDRGLLYPGQFLKLAESSGLLSELTDFVFADAMRQAGVWEAQGLDLAVDINLSPGLVRDAGFLERFMRSLKEYDVSAERITLEVIEAASLQDRELVRDVLTRLRLHGVGLSLDDFGTGYSSLTELCRLPFSEIKIDRTLIHDVPDSRQASTVVSAIIDLAHRLSIRVCAEGVETEQAFDFLKDAGCDSLQGVLFAPPMPARDVEQLARLQPNLAAVAALRDGSIG
jgi:EAL domain-containing protein (putative c-di-GMP-specific phosphodiesterase class I)